MKSDTHDLRIELRARNNILWHAIFDHWPSVLAFCKHHTLATSSVGNWLNLTDNPYRAVAGDALASPLELLKPQPRRLCEIFGLTPEELFPPALYEGNFPLRHVIEAFSGSVVSLSAAKRMMLPPAQDDAIMKQELVDTLDRSLSTLTPREAWVIKARFGLLDGKEHTLGEVAEVLGVGKQRANQIEAKALRKLRHPHRSKPLRPFRHI